MILKELICSGYGQAVQINCFNYTLPDARRASSPVPMIQTRVSSANIHVDYFVSTLSAPAILVAAC
jgi:hypothetical protein